MKSGESSKIIIIHPALIVREGLVSLIKSLFDLTALSVPEIQDLAGYENWREKKLVVLADSRINQEEFQSRIKEYQSSNEVNIVLIREPGSPSECAPDCSCCFYTDVDQESLHSILEPFLRNDGPSLSRTQLGLTDREIDVVTQVALGKTNREIADALCISIHTVISHRKNITEKLGIKSISGLTVYAILNNLIDANTIDPETLI